jgi:hypothetical protein
VVLDCDKTPDRCSYSGTRLRAVVRIRPARLREDAAIHAKRLAGDERRSITEEEFYGGGYIVRSADAAQGREARSGFCEVGQLIFGSLGGDAVYADSVRTQLQSRGFGEHFNSVLAGRVTGKIGEGNLLQPNPISTMAPKRRSFAYSRVTGVAGALLSAERLSR